MNKMTLLEVQVVALDSGKCLLYIGRYFTILADFISPVLESVNVTSHSSAIEYSTRMNFTIEYSPIELIIFH